MVHAVLREGLARGDPDGVRLSLSIRSRRFAIHRCQGGGSGQCVRVIFAEDPASRVENCAVFGPGLLPAALLAQD